MKRQNAYIIVSPEGFMLTDTVRSTPGKSWLSLPVHRAEAMKAGFRCGRVSINLIKNMDLREQEKRGRS